MFEASVDRFGVAVAGTRAVELREYLSGTPLMVRAYADLGEGGADANGDGADDGLDHLPSLLLIGVTTGDDDPLVAALGGFNLEMLVICEGCVQAGPLLFNEQTCTGAQCPSDSVQMSSPATAVLERLPDPLLRPPPRLAMPGTGRPTNHS